MRSCLFALGILLATILLPPRAHAGPWVDLPGHGYAKVWLKWLPGFAYSSGAREGFVMYGAYHELFLNGYAEVSVAPHLALSLHLPLVQQFLLEDPRSGTLNARTTPGDPTVGARWMMWKGAGFAIALQASVKAPINRGGSVLPVYSTEPGNPKIADVRAGTGTWDIQGGLSFGYADARFYVAASASYMFRTLDFDDVLLWDAEGGFHPHPDWFLRFRLRGFHLLRNGRAPYQETLNGAGNGTEYTAFAIEGEWSFRPQMVLGLGLEGGLFGVLRQTGGPVISLYWAASW